MNLRTLIIDDEPLAHDIIIEYVKSVPFIEIVAQSYLATEALVVLKDKNIDLIFLDINMPKIKGLDFLRTLKNKPIVIITSAYEEYALESFELDVCDYLHKPFRFDRFLKAVNKALELFELKNQSTSASPIPSSESVAEQSSLFIKSDKRYIHIQHSDIIFLESYGNYVKIWLENDFHLTPATLSSFQVTLPQANFIRIHKSFIVNKHHINYVEGNTIRMKNDKEVAIGKNYRQLVKELFT